MHPVRSNHWVYNVAEHKFKTPIKITGAGWNNPHVLIHDGDGNLIMDFEISTGRVDTIDLMEAMALLYNQAHGISPAVWVCANGHEKYGPGQCMYVKSGDIICGLFPKLRIKEK